MKTKKTGNLRREASQALDTVGEALTLYAELRRFMRDLAIDFPTFAETTLVARKMSIAGILPLNVSPAACWMALELILRIGNDEDLDTDTIDYLADDLLNPIKKNK